MTRYLFVHAHPDDETLATGALLIALSRAGHECAVLTATRGEKGEVVPGTYDGLEGTPELTRVREAELATAVAVLGVTQHAMLGAPPARTTGLAPRTYTDSGMRWVTPTLAGPGDDAGPDSLTSADIAEVVADIVACAEALTSEVLVSYGDDGGYGHPDHIRCHEATRLAAAELGLPFQVIVTHRDLPYETWYSLDAYGLESLHEAHRAYTTQFTVDGHDVTHVGGQRQRMVTSAGLAAAP